MFRIDPLASCQQLGSPCVTLGGRCVSKTKQNKKMAHWFLYLGTIVSISSFLWVIDTTGKLNSASSTPPRMLIHLRNATAHANRMFSYSSALRPSHSVRARKPANAITSCCRFRYSHDERSHRFRLYIHRTVWPLVTDWMLLLPSKRKYIYILLFVYCIRFFFFSFIAGRTEPE